jgi:hypothetical protein
VKRLSRVLDTIWVTSAFDPRRPVDPDWASRAPAPILRSGDEGDIFGGVYEHNHHSDEMQSSPEGTGAVDPEFEEEELGDLPPSDQSEMSAKDLMDLGEHARNVQVTGGRLDGSQGSYVEYHPVSSVNHYYTYNPHSGDGGHPWNLVSTHWMAHPVQSRHRTFMEAVFQANHNRHEIDRRVG